MEEREIVEILRALIRSKGTEYLRQGNLFVNAVDDMHGMKEDIRLLKYLVETEGHLALLDAGKLPRAQQQTRYSQTVKKLCEKTLISEELSHNVCAAFWRAVYNTEPPISPPPKPAPAPQPEPLSPDEIYVRACECDRKGKLTEAAKLYRQAAELGHAEAQCDFGCYLLKGDGVAKDSTQAVNWFQKSAAQGYAKAQNWLGICYAVGNGVPQDYFEAVKWYRKAAEQKDPYAQNNLSIRYEDGEGVPRDLEQAVAWCRKAAEQGHEEAKKRLPALEAQLATEKKYDSLPKRSTGERWLLTLGWGCLLAVVALFIGAAKYILTEFSLSESLACLLVFFILFFSIARCQYGLWHQRGSLGVFYWISMILNCIICLILGGLLKADIVQKWCETIDAGWMEPLALIFLIADILYFYYSFDYISHFPAPSAKSAHRKSSLKHKALFRPEHSTGERRLLILGWMIILAYTLFILAACIRGFTNGKLPGMLPELIASSLGLTAFFIFPVARRQYCLWNQVTENWKPSKKLLSWIYEELAGITEFTAFTVLISPLLAFIPDFREILNEPWMLFFDAFDDGLPVLHHLLYRLLYLAPPQEEESLTQLGKDLCA